MQGAIQAYAWNCSRWRLHWHPIRLWRQRPQGHGQRRSKEVRSSVAECTWHLRELLWRLESDKLPVTDIRLFVM